MTPPSPPRRAPRWSDPAVAGLSRLTGKGFVKKFTRRFRGNVGSCLGRHCRVAGDALENLVTSGAVPPADALPVGLMILSALAGFCRSNSSSVLQRAA
jgi:hypothetical protein